MFTESELMVMYGQFMKDFEMFDEEENKFELNIIKKIREQLGETHYCVVEWDEYWN